MGVLALIGATLEKLAVEIRGLQKSEVREVEEAFGKGQKGSSAMPHKRNPVGSENITGCARLLRGYMVAAYENVALWHERDISHSSVERVIIPDATIVLHYALHRMASIVEHLVVYEKNMARNMERTYGLYHSQRLLLKLIDTGMDREAAYDLVQPLAMRAWEEERSFREIVSSEPAVQRRLRPEEIEEAFDVRYHVRRVDDLFARVGLH
jgi:adenylosuccinate lyase